MGTSEMIGSDEIAIAGSGTTKKSGFETDQY
jgi:hypothetical protein